jgi:hypothetical protein
MNSIESPLDELNLPAIPGFVLHGQLTTTVLLHTQYSFTGTITAHAPGGAARPVIYSRETLLNPCTQQSIPGLTQVCKLALQSSP